MNWLAHFALSPSHGGVLMGNWLADLVPRSELDGIVDPGIRQGLELHRLIDSVTDRHPAMRTALAGFPKALRRTGGIVLDVAWDHFLSLEFERRTGRDLHLHVDDVLTRLEATLPLAPIGTEQVLSRMREEDWLRSYGSLEGVELALTRISRRLGPRASTALSPRHAVEHLRASQDQFRKLFDLLWRDVSAEVARSGLARHPARPTAPTPTSRRRNPLR